jgi:hypothetical protein
VSVESGWINSGNILASKVANSPRSEEDEEDEESDVDYDIMDEDINHRVSFSKAVFYKVCTLLKDVFSFECEAHVLRTYSWPSYYKAYSPLI